MVTAASNLLESLSRKGGSLEMLILWRTRVPERRTYAAVRHGTAGVKSRVAALLATGRGVKMHQGVFRTRDSSLTECARGGLDCEGWTISPTASSRAPGRLEGERARMEVTGFPQRFMVLTCTHSFEPAVLNIRWEQSKERKGNRGIICLRLSYGIVLAPTKFGASSAGNPAEYQNFPIRGKFGASSMCLVSS